MPDLSLSVTVSRTPLGLGLLEIASGNPYYMSPQLLGGQLTWNRVQVTSPFTDGQFTTQRSRQNVTETIGVEIRATTAAELQSRTAELIAAFSQDSFTLTVTVDGAVYAYQCEAADYQIVTWSTPRMVALQGQALFQVPRRPLAVTGGV